MTFGMLSGRQAFRLLRWIGNRRPRDPWLCAGGRRDSQAGSTTAESGLAWVEFYPKLDELARERLPVPPIYFITPRGKPAFLHPLT